MCVYILSRVVITVYVNWNIMQICFLQLQVSFFFHLGGLVLSIQVPNTNYSNTHTHKVDKSADFWDGGL